jgi:hypothetical protein
MSRYCPFNGFLLLFSRSKDILLPWGTPMLCRGSAFLSLVGTAHSFFIKGIADQDFFFNNYLFIGYLDNEPVSHVSSKKMR